MFKKKTNLPARPPIPSRDQILQDLSNASPDDIVFKHGGEKTVADASDMFSLSDDLIDYESEVALEHQNPSYTCKKVESFVEKINCLERHVYTLQEQKEDLKKLEESLSREMTKIEKELGKNSQPSL